MKNEVKRIKVNNGYVYYTSNKRIMKKLVDNGFMIIYDESLYSLGNNIILVYDYTSFKESILVLNKLEEILNIELPYKINGVIETGAFNCELFK